MSNILDYDLDDVAEPEVLPTDEEAKLRIVGVTIGEDKNGNPYLLPRFEVVDRPYAKEFNRFLRLPHDGQSEKQLNNSKHQLKHFYTAFGIDYSKTVDPDSDLPGAEGWALLGIEEYQGDERNFVKRFIEPR